MTNKCCTECGQPWPAGFDPDDRIQVKAAAIREWCRLNSAGPFFGDEIRRSDAAKFIDRAEKTFQHYDIPPQRHRGRTYFLIEDLARFIVSGLN